MPVRSKVPVKLPAVDDRNSTSPSRAVVVTAPGLSLVAVPVTRRLPKTRAPSAGDERARFGELLTGTSTVMERVLPLASVAVITRVCGPLPAWAAFTVKR